MASNPPVAVYDACVLYPFHLRNILIQCAFDGLAEARWTDDILMSGCAISPSTHQVCPSTAWKLRATG